MTIVLGVTCALAAAAPATGGCGGDDTANPVSFADAQAPVDAPPDTTVADALPDVVGCPPRDLGGFDAAWTAPTAFHEKRCSNAQVATFAACLQPNHDVAACTAFLQASENADCLKCGASDQHAFGGCIAVATGDPSPTGCAAKFEALILCSNYACAACPLPTPFDTRDAGTSALAGFCQQEAQNGVCKSYLDASQCTRALVADGGAAAICRHPGDIAFFLDLFCGEGSADGGLDAPTDG